MTSRTLPLLLVSFFTLCFPGAVPARAANELGTDPALFNRKLDAAVFKGDIAFLNAVIADDLVMTVNGKQPETQRDLFDKKRWVTFIGTAKYVSRDIVDEKIERHENMVIATAIIHYRYVNGPLMELVQMRVYQQRPSGWQLVSHRTLREEAAKPER